MDFIEGLPKVNGFKVIFVVVDRFSKYDLFVKEVGRLHGYPLLIVSIETRCSLSNFWRELFRSAGCIPSIIGWPN